MRLSRPRVAAVMVAFAAIALAANSYTLSAQTPQSPGNAAAAIKAKTFDPITHEGYIEPPEPLKSLVDAPRTSLVSWSNANPGTRKYLMRTLSEGMPPLAQMGSPYINLAAWQVDNRGNRARNLTSRSLFGIELLDWAANKTIKVEIPANARAANPIWSPDGTTLAYFANFENATHIYLVDPATGKSRPLTTRSVLATNVPTFYWTGDSKSIVVVMTPEGRPAEPKEPTIATEPMVRVNEGNRLRTRTFFDLIRSPHEMNLLEYHMTGQLAVIDVKTRAIKKVGSPSMIRTISASPDAMYFRVTSMDRPFSYYQQTGSFGTTEILIDHTGKQIRELGKRELQEGTPVDPDPDPTNPADPDTTNAAPRGQGARAGGQGRGNRGGGGGDQTPAGPDTTRRSVTWHPYEKGQMFFQLGPATGSEPNAPRNDRIMLIPDLADTMATKVIYETPNRIQQVRFSENGRILFVTEATPAPAGGRTGGGGGNAPAGGGRTGGGAGRTGGGGGGQGGGGQATGAQTFEVAVFLDQNNQKFTITTSRGGGAGQQGGGRDVGVVSSRGRVVAVAAAVVALVDSLPRPEPKAVR